MHVRDVQSWICFQFLVVMAICTNCLLLVCLYDAEGNWRIEPGLAAILIMEHALLLIKFGFSHFVPEVIFYIYLLPLYISTYFFITEAPICGLLGSYCPLGACVGESKSSAIRSSGTKCLFQTTFEEHFKIGRQTGLRNIRCSLEDNASFVA